MTKPKLGASVIYVTNGVDLANKTEKLPAIVRGYSKRELPAERDEKGNVVKTREVDAVELSVLQNDTQNPVALRSQVVEKSDSESAELNYKLPYFIVEEETSVDVAGKAAEVATKVATEIATTVAAEAVAKAIAPAQ